MHVTARAVQDQFYEARMEFEDLIEQLLSPAAAGLTHSQAEDLIERQGREVLRQLLQGWLETPRRRRRRAGVGGPRRGAAHPAAPAQPRAGEPLRHGAGRATRLWRPRAGEPASARRGAEPARGTVFARPAQEGRRGGRPQQLRGGGGGHRGAYRGAGAQTPGRGAVSAGRAGLRCLLCAAPCAAAGPAGRSPPGLIVVLTTDGKGVPMRKEALRAQTRKAAEASTHKLRTRLSKGEKRHRKRMATVASVYSIAPYVRRADDVVRELAPVHEVRTERRPQPQGKRVWASVRQEPRAVIAEMFDEARGRDPEGQRPWVVLVDGQEHQLRLIRQEVKRRSVAVTLILDLFHVLEYLWAAAFAFHAEGSAEAELWVRTQLLALLRGRVSQVAAAMRRSATVRAFTASKRAAVDKCADYLLKYRDMLRYDQGAGRVRHPRRRGVRLPQPGAHGGRGARGLRHPGRRGVDRLPRRAQPARRRSIAEIQASVAAGARGDRHRHLPRARARPATGRRSTTRCAPSATPAARRT